MVNNLFGDVEVKNVAVTKSIEVSKSPLSPTGYSTRFTVRVTNNYPEAITHPFEVLEVIPDSIATWEERLSIRFSIPPSRLEKGSIKAFWQVNGLEANQSFQVSYAIDKKIEKEQAQALSKPLVANPVPVVEATPTAIPVVKASSLKASDYMNLLLVLLMLLILAAVLSKKKSLEINGLAKTEKPEEREKRKPVEKK